MERSPRLGKNGLGESLETPLWYLRVPSFYISNIGTYISKYMYISKSHNKLE